MERPIKILMLEDNDSDAGLIVWALKKANLNFNSKLVDTRQEFTDALEEYVPDVVLSDHSLVNFNSLDAFKICKDKNLEVPFILVTGTVSEEFAVKCLQQGIDDYILKDNLTRLPTSIEHAVRKRDLELSKKILELRQQEDAEKLKQQNQELVKINKELDRLVYSVSHELKAPLKSILGLIKLTQMEYVQKEFRMFEDYFQMMEKSVDKLSNTIEEVVLYSLNNHVQVQRELVDINALLAKVWEKLSPIEGINELEKKVSIELDYPLNSDEHRLSVILESLISNSIKYRNRNGEKPMVSVKILVSSNRAYFVVEDNGVGIPDKYMDKIFDMFVRVSALSEGPGLGLYIVKEAVDKMDGKIKVKSEVNKGTTFFVEIPNYQ